jgi:hypothetical protein
MNPVTKLALELSVEDAQVVLNALGDQRYNSVAGLIDNLRNQIIPQIQQQQAPAELTPEEPVPAK